jgi:hypothetical protein
LIEAQLPEDPRVLSTGSGSEVIILVTWRLKTDPTRPNKRSRMIRIVISQEAVEDYMRGSGGERIASDRRLVTWFREQLKKFEPDHDAPLGVDPPGVAWALDTRLLNG